MKKFTLNKIVLRILGVILFAILWQILSMIIGETTFIFPSPYLTVVEAMKMLSESYVYTCLFNTLTRMVYGFMISFAIAFIFGVIAGNYSYVEELLKPTISVLKSIPTASLVYLFLVVAGARLTPMFIVILICLPILYESIVGGIKATPQGLLEASRIDGASLWHTNLKVRIPLAKPYIMVGVASSFGLALKIEIMAEVITGYTRLGLGSAILAAQRSDPTNMVPVFAYSLVTIVLIFIIDSLSGLIKQKYKQS